MKQIRKANHNVYFTFEIIWWASGTNSKISLICVKICVLNCYKLFLQQWQFGALTQRCYFRGVDPFFSFDWIKGRLKELRDEHKEMNAKKMVRVNCVEFGGRVITGWKFGQMWQKVLCGWDVNTRSAKQNSKTIGHRCMFIICHRC